MSSQHDYAMEEIRAAAARNIGATLDKHLEHISRERLYPYNVQIVEAAARITEALANALAAVSK